MYANVFWLHCENITDSPRRSSRLQRGHDEHRHAWNKQRPDQLEMIFFFSCHCPSVHNRSARLHVLLFSCLWILRYPRASSSLSNSSEVWTTAFERWGMNFRHGKGHRPLDYDCCGLAVPHFVTAKTNSEAFSKKKERRKHSQTKCSEGKTALRPVLLLHTFLKRLNNSKSQHIHIISVINQNSIWTWQPVRTMHFHWDVGG